MPDIKITVRGKIATSDGSRIVCGNSDYSILFDFDAEWDDYDVKTARFVYAGMTGKYIDVVFSGTTCQVPVLQDAIGVYVGVYAGELHTTTPAWFECDKSILCGGGSPAAPPDDVYNQIMERLNKLGTPDAEAIAAAVADYIAANPIEEKDPTVPDWAKTAAKPGYTAAEVGADPSGTAASQVSAHNAETTAHSDIRLLIQGLTDRLNALADSDDTTLDQLSEIVAYIKDNRDLIAAVTTDKVSVSDIVDNLTTNVANTPLSAAQGVALKALIDAINAVSIGAIPAPATASVGQTIRVSAVDETGQPTEWEAVDMASEGSGNISLPLLYDLTTEEEVRWIDTGDNAFEANSFVIVDLYSVATETNTSNQSGSASIYPITSGVLQAPWNNYSIARQVSGMLPYNNDKVFRALCFRGEGGYWTTIASIRDNVNLASVTTGMIATKLDGITDQPMRGIIIGDSSASSGTRVLGAGSRLRVWGI